MAKTQRLKVGDRRSQKQFEQLLAEGRTIADKDTPGALAWGYKSTYLLVRARP